MAPEPAGLPSKPLPRKNRGNPSMFWLGRLESVADFTDGVNEDRAGGVRLDFVPQGGDKSVYSALSNNAIVTPDGV